MSTAFTTKLPGGTLHLHIEQSALPLDELCDFATRANPRRRFLFVSKVLGKHHATQPSRMREIHQFLADLLHGLPEPIVVLGMAETATALGHGVFDCLAVRESLLLYTTRYRLSQEIAAVFEESHSHATRHIVYWPTRPDLRHRLRSARTIVVVDDELSTGNTAANLLKQLSAIAPQASYIRIATIMNWMDSTQRHEFEARLPGRDVRFVSLLDGRFSFENNNAFSTPATHDATGNGALKDHIIAGNHGRLGLDAPLNFPFRDWVLPGTLRQGARVLVLGSGEFMYPPFLFAQWLEEQGADVWFQSSTRSPILQGDGIKSIVATLDNYDDGIPNFVYNLNPSAYDYIYIGYETRNAPVAHDLPRQLNATRLDFF